MGAIMGKLKGLFEQREMRVLMNGLDCAGKTTILYRWKLGEIVTTIPTIGACRLSRADFLARAHLFRESPRERAARAAAR